MVAVSDWQYMTPEEYLAWEATQTDKYEYINGEILAMTGGTIPHNDIAVNITTALKNHLRGKGCKVSMSDAKVGISEQNIFYYPDVMVSCNINDLQAIKAIYSPCLIVEVLSPTTERIDRGKKFQNYRYIPSLTEYVLVSTEQMLVEVFRIKEGDIWELHTYTKENELCLTSINFSCSLEMVYEDVVLQESD